MMTKEDCSNFTIMIVDDTVANLKLLEGILKEQGYVTRSLPRGKLAVKAALTSPPDLILLDINMPDISGYEVCQQLKQNESTRDVPIIFISALSHVTDKVNAFTSGGVDYITKPFQAEEVYARVEAHLRIRKMQAELEKHNKSLQVLVQEQIEDILQAKEEVEKAQSATIIALSKISEDRDEDTGNHIERTRTYCLALAKCLQGKPEFKDIIDDAFVQNIYSSAPLHDIGKVGISDAILKKPGKLTDDEFETMKTHTSIGSKNLQTVLDSYPNNSFIKMGVEIARSHHEKWNGFGYPDGLKEDEIPLSAQIMAVADVYDALRSQRCYKPAFTHEKSKDIIIADTGTHFSPAVGTAFKEVEAEFYKISLELAD